MIISISDSIIIIDGNNYPNNIKFNLIFMKDKVLTI